MDARWAMSPKTWWPGGYASHEIVALPVEEKVYMTRESSLVRSFVELADTLVEDFDVIDLLTRLADRCVSILGVSAAGVMLASAGGDLRLVASSSETMRVLE